MNKNIGKSIILSLLIISSLVLSFFSTDYENQSNVLKVIFGLIQFATPFILPLYFIKSTGGKIFAFLFLSIAIGLLFWASGNIDNVDAFPFFTMFTGYGFLATLIIYPVWDRLTK